MSLVRARRWRSGVAALGLGVIVVVSGCAGSTSGDPVTKTSATFAELPGSQPNYILPLSSLQYFSVSNISQFQKLLYRPLYWFGTNGQVELNNSLSLAYPPVYSSDGTSVTVTLKGWKWSDGTQITARDIQFWQNLVTANKDYWAGYTPGEYPDNVLSTTINPRNPLEITFNLNQAYGAYFFTYNELSQITPLPQRVWDKESAAGPVGNYDETPAGAQQVYQYLDSETKSISTYDTDPLWKVVSGPWKLQSMDTAGNVSMLPNTNYGGPVKPTLTRFNEVSFSTDATEFDRLKSAPSVSGTTVDYGYLPYVYASQRSSLSSAYTLAPWSGWRITYVSENFTNPPADRSSASCTSGRRCRTSSTRAPSLRARSQATGIRPSAPCRQDRRQFFWTRPGTTIRIRTVPPRRLRCCRPTDGQLTRAGSAPAPARAAVPVIAGRGSHTEPKHRSRWRMRMAIRPSQRR
jgi:peptide/nickel transport system substrate-binding protein